MTTPEELAQAIERLEEAVDRAGHINDAGRQRVITVMTTDASILLATVHARIDAVRDAMQAVDDADADCPVRHPNGWKYPRRADGHCPKCYASTNQNCGPEVSAYSNLADACRAALSLAARDALQDPPP